MSGSSPRPVYNQLGNTVCPFGEVLGGDRWPDPVAAL